MATGITKDAGNNTLRVWAREDAGDAAMVVTQFGAPGCLIQGYGDKLIGL